MTQPLLAQLMKLSPEQRRAVLEQVRKSGAGSSSIPRLDRLSGDVALPASFGQDRLWFLWQLAPGSATYHVAWSYEVAGGLEVDRLAAAVDALVLRHEVLRTTLHEQDGQIVQRVGPPWRCGLAAVPATSEQAFEAATQAARELFDLSAGPLLRVRAWELAPDRHVVAFTTHHVVMDGWSLDVFERELWALYEAGGDAAAAGLSALDIQYADYASWHRGLTATRADEDLAYWRHALDGATPACPAPDHPAPDRTDFSGDQTAITVPASELHWLTTTRTAAGTDFVALFAIWCLFLARHTGQRDLTVGTLVSGRSHPDTAALIGYFVNTLALRVRIDPGTDFPAYLRAVRATVLDAFAHQEIPFDHVVRAVAPRRTAARNPLFTTMFSYTPAEGADWQNRTLANGLKLSALPVTAGGSHLDLGLTASATPQGLVLRLEYSTDLYDPATIDGYLGSLASLIEAVSRDPAAPLRALVGDGQPATAENGDPGSAGAGSAGTGSGDPGFAGTEFVEPATETEQQIAQIWAGQLSLDVAEIGAGDDFFAIGGHSLLAVRLALKLSTDLRIDFPVHQVFATPTITGQAAYADALGGQPAMPPIPALPDSGDSGSRPASFGQERLWFLWQLAPDSATYHVSWCYQARGLDVPALAAAVDAMIARHEILRTTMHEQDGQIVQRVGPPWRCALTAAPAAPAEAAADAAAAAGELFDLSAGPLLRVRAWDTGQGAHLLLFTAHHVVIDEWSLEVFEQELWALYGAGGDAAAAGLSALDIQYADYASWHRGLTATRADEDLAYWRHALDGATPACPAPDHPAPDRTDFSGDQTAITVPASELHWLTTTRTAAGTDFVALFAIWCLFLARHTGQRDLTVGTLVSGRSHPDTAALIGYFVNTLALRVRIDPGTDFPAYLRAVRATVLDAFAHQEIPFDHVVRAVAPRRTAARNPLFTTMFSYLTETDEDINTRDLPGGLSLTPVPSVGGGSHFDLSLTAARTPGGLVLRLEYSTDLYDPATIDGYLGSLTSLLGAVSHDPAARLHAFLEPTPRERQLLTAWNDVSAAPAAPGPLHDLIAVQAAATPDVIAIEAQDTSLTYRQLDTGATSLARRLRRAGVRDGDIVGIHLRPGAVAITAILAAWKAGAAFLPLDPDLPPARIIAMVDDAHAALLVTDKPSACPGLDFLLGQPPGQGERHDDEDAALPAVGPHHLAYLMYTSGSTGQPKAVMIAHRGLSNHATAQLLPRTGAERKRVATGTSAFIADFFISQLAALAGGHTLVVLTREQRQDPRYLVGLAADPDRAITALDCTTSQLQLFVEAGLLDAPHPPRVASFGGEACPPDLWAALRAYPALTAVNTYGPAETAVDATIFNVAESPLPLIGRPYGNVRVSLLDDQQRPVPPGTIGELCIAGPGVGPGYLGRPGPDRRRVHPRPRRLPGQPPVPHRRPGPLHHRRAAGIPRAQRPPDQDPGPARRARGSRDGAARPPRHHRGCRHRPRHPRRHPAHRPPHSRSRHHPGPRPAPGVARRAPPRRRRAGHHPLRRRPPPHPRRQARPQGPHRRRGRPRLGPRPCQPAGHSRRARHHRHLG